MSSPKMRSNDSSVPRGRFVWYEFLTEDPAGAMAFYTRAMGWSIEEWSGGERPYPMWVSKRGPMGGVMQLPDEGVAHGAPSHWLGYIATDDVDSTVAQAERMGATVLAPPFDVEEVGRLSVLNDPQEAIFAVFAPSGDSPGPDGVPAVGDMSWHELTTSDHEAAFVFYSALFGWEKTDAMDMGPMGIYQMFGIGEVVLGGMYNKPKDQPGPPASWLYYTRVDSVEAAIARVNGAGGQLLNGPQEVPGGDRVAQCMDPQGAPFAIHEVVNGSLGHNGGG